MEYHYQYIAREMVPRGLRIKKNPTFQACEIFTTKWNQIPSDCALKLIHLLISYEQEKLTDITRYKEGIANLDRQSS